LSFVEIKNKSIVCQIDLIQYEFKSMILFRR